MVRFLASLKLALIVLTTLIVLMIYGTVVEARHGASFARAAVYLSKPFLAAELALFLNVLFSTLVRLPLRRRLAGFYITHLGLLFIMIGAAMTLRFGLNGTVDLVPGEPTRFAKMDEALLYVLETPAGTDGTPELLSINLPDTAAASDGGGLKATGKNYDFALKRFLPYAVPAASLRRNSSARDSNAWAYKPPSKDGGGRNAALFLSVEPRGKKDVATEYWVNDGGTASATLADGTRLDMTIAPKLLRLPFRIELDDFRVKTDADGDNPSDYASHVSLYARENRTEAVIAMNQPLKTDAFTLYQSSYFEMDGGRGYASVLSLNSDPGRNLKYVGSVFLVAGSLLHFGLRAAAKRRPAGAIA